MNFHPQASFATSVNIAAFTIAGEQIYADRSGVLYIPASQTLVVADLHFEKGSAFAARGMMLPPYDTTATLARLAQVITFYNPRAVIALGDSFHDRAAAARMDPANRRALLALQKSRDWLWIAGNHDPAPPDNLGGEARAVFMLGPLTFRHEPKPGAATGEIAGHLHPVVRVAGRGASLRCRCFASDGQRCIVPAFGAYAGGLNIRDQAFAGLFGPQLAVHALGRERVFAIHPAACQPDSQSRRKITVATQPNNSAKPPVASP